MINSAKSGTALSMRQCRPRVSLSLNPGYSRFSMNHDRYDDAYIRGILNTVKTIAVVGVSANTSRPSYFVFKYLSERGYHMIPVNPGLAGQHLLGRMAYATLVDAPEPIDIVDRFPAPQHVLAALVAALVRRP